MTKGRALAPHLYERLSARVPIVALGMIVAGVVLGCVGARRALTPQLPALRGDPWLVAACGMVLAGCALFFRARASSRFSCRIADFVAAAVVVAVVAGLIEGGLRSITSLGTPTAAAATIMFCAASVAAVGVFASIGIAARDLMGSQMLRPRKLFGWMGIGARDESGPKPLWDALAPSGLPATDKAVIQNQQSWLRAYDVPGVTKALKNRNESLRALCLSGGGVRSACVAMGAMQVLSKPCGESDTAASANGGRTAAAGLLDRLDYVISVSGGGYTAGARLLAVQPQHVDPNQKGTKKRLQAQPRRPSTAPISKRFEEGSAEFGHIRRGSSYIADSPLELIRAFAEVLKNLLASLVTIFTIPVLAGWPVGWLLAEVPIAAFPPVPAAHEAELKGHGGDSLSLAAHPAAYWALGFFAAGAVLFTMAALVIEWKWDGPSSERWRGRMLGLARGSAGFALVVFTLTIALPGLMRLCWWAGNQSPTTPASAFAALSGVVGLNYVAALIAIIWRDTNKLAKSDHTQRSSSMLKRILPPEVVSLLLTVATLAALLVVWLALLGSFAAGVFGYTQSADPAGFLKSCWWVLGLLFTAAFFGFADVTSLSLHPFYRRRLARTFAVRRTPDKGERNEAVRYSDNEPTWLHLYGRVTHGPKFVFACSATITGPDKPAPGLNAVSYVMSADYVGGPELGWFDTEKLFYAAPPRIRRDLTVEAAVAVSGAAFASAMGRENKGLEKLLAVSGARLGTWLPNPKFVSQLKRAASSRNSTPDRLRRACAQSLPSVRGAGYLYREILGINNEDARLVQVTDGGHYDNSGLVEALRRRCRLIIVIDGGGDPPPLPVGLTDALRLAKYELGVDVTLKRTGQYSVASIAPGSGTQFAKDNALAGLNSRVTRGAVVEGKITYPAAAGLKDRVGTLIFVKAVVSQACPYWLLTYAASNEIFPHDPTSDQWFNEAQFAAYTELGRVIAEEAVDCIRSCKLIDDIAPAAAIALTSTLPTMVSPKAP
jgi:MFS family permease